MMPYKCDHCGHELPDDHLLGQTVGTIPNARVCGSTCASSWVDSRPEKTEWEWRAVSEWVQNFREGLRDHPFYCQPSDDETIWRYLDLPKFLDLLQTSQLYLTAAHLFGDPFEGSLSNETIRRFEVAASQTAAQFAAVVESYDVTAGQAFMLQARRGHHEWERQWTYVSCWHVNAHESAAMWAAYGRRSDAIAIRSGVGRLRTCIERHQEPPHGFPIIAKVYYRDYTNEAVETGFVLAPLLQKRTSFAHENELRVVVQRLPHVESPGTGGQMHDMVKSPIAGIRLDVDLHALIEELFVAPDAAPWFVNVVRSITEKYGLNVEVRQSGLFADSPVF